MDHKMYHKVIIVVILLLVFDHSFGQVDSAGSQGFVTYETTDPRKLMKSSKNKKYHSNALKSGVFAPLIGKYGVAYERELNSRFSIEAGLGLTGRNLTGMALANEMTYGDDEQDSPNFIYYNDEWDEDYTFSNRDAELGWYVSLMPRMYFQQAGFDGNYWGINFQYKHYNFDAYSLAPSLGELQYDPSLPPVHEFENNMVISLNYGIQTLREHFIFDWYWSLGANFVNGERRDVGYEPIPGTQFSHPAVGSKPREVSTVRLYVEIGLQLGGWWE